MPYKTHFAKLYVVLSAAALLALGVALRWYSPVRAQGKKEFKGATVQNDRLVLKPGFKLRQVSAKLVETFKEEAEGSGPTVRRATKPVAVDRINVECVCGGTTNSTNCETIVRGTGASCRAKSNACSKCEMIAVESK